MKWLLPVLVTLTLLFGTVENSTAISERCQKAADIYFTNFTSQLAKVSKPQTQKFDYATLLDRIEQPQTLKKGLVQQKELERAAFRKAIEQVEPDSAGGIAKKPESKEEVRLTANTDLTTSSYFTPPLDKAIEETLVLLAEIAKKRLQQRGLMLAKKRLEEVVCETRIQKNMIVFDNHSGEQILPNTCKLIQTTSLDTLINRVSDVRVALLSDSIDFVDRKARLEMGDDTYNDIRLVIRLAKSLAAKKAYGLSEAQLENLLNELMVQNVGKANSPIQSDEIVAAIGIAKKLAVEKKLPTDCSYPETIEYVFQKIYGSGNETVLPNAETISEVIKWTGIVLELIKPDDEQDQEKAAKKLLERYRKAVSLVMDVAERKAEDALNDAEKENSKVHEFTKQLKLIKAVHATVMAVLDDDVAETVQAVSDAIFNICTNYKNGLCDDQKVKKGLSFLKLTGQFAATYQAPNIKTDDSAEKIKLLHEQRKQFLESFMDATTDRSNRAGESVTSVGMNIGVLLAGRQWKHAAAENESKVEDFYGQLSLPVGVAWQRLPGGGCSLLPHHLMLTLLDLGQYVAWTEKSGLTNQRWDTAISPGIQIGWLLGAPDNAISFGVQAGIAPTLFAPGNDIHSSKSGAIRAGFFLQYYVPIFDFN